MQVFFENFLNFFCFFQRFYQFSHAKIVFDVNCQILGKRRVTKRQLCYLLVVRLHVHFIRNGGKLLIL